MLTLLLITAIVTTYFIVRIDELDTEPATIRNTDNDSLGRR